MQVRNNGLSCWRTERNVSLVLDSSACRLSGLWRCAPSPLCEPRTIAPVAGVWTSAAGRAPRPPTQSIPAGSLFLIVATRSDCRPSSVETAPACSALSRTHTHPRADPPSCHSGSIAMATLKTTRKHSPWRRDYGNLLLEWCDLEYSRGICLLVIQDSGSGIMMLPGPLLAVEVVGDWCLSVKVVFFLFFFWHFVFFILSSLSCCYFFFFPSRTVMKQKNRAVITTEHHQTPSDTQNKWGSSDTSWCLESRKQNDYVFSFNTINK